MLEKAYSEMPDTALIKTDRFEIPKVRGHIQGNRTVISNIGQIAMDLRRDTNHLVKFLLKELATPGKLSGSGSLIIGAKVAASRINDKIKQYTDDYVVCAECGKPDTELLKEGGLTYKRCLACGAKKHVRAKN